MNQVESNGLLREPFFLLPISLLLAGVGWCWTSRRIWSWVRAWPGAVACVAAWRLFPGGQEATLKVVINLAGGRNPHLSPTEFWSQPEFCSQTEFWCQTEFWFSRQR